MTGFRLSIVLRQWLSLLFVSLCVCTSHGTAQVRPILNVDRWSSGPFEGRKSESCLAVYSDGKVDYVRRWNRGKVVIDPKSGKKVLLEHTVSVENSLTHAKLFEISHFLESDPVKALEPTFVLPHSPIDYNEGATIYVLRGGGAEMRISIRDYGEADLEDRSKLPGALIVLMDQIELIEKAAVSKGRQAKILSKCSPSE